MERETQRDTGHRLSRSALLLTRTALEGGIIASAIGGVLGIGDIAQAWVSGIAAIAALTLKILNVF